MQQVNKVNGESHCGCVCVTPETTPLPTATMTLLLHKPVLWYHFTSTAHPPVHLFLHAQPHLQRHTHMHSQKIKENTHNFKYRYEGDFFFFLTEM